MGIYGIKKDIPKDLVEKRLKKNSKNIIAALIEHYISGLMDDPHANDIFMTTMMLIAEGKIKGIVRDKDNFKIDWALVDDDSRPWNVVDTCYYSDDK